MAISIETVTPSAKGGYGATHTFSATAGTNSGRCVLVLCGGPANFGTTPTAVTFGGFTLTKGTNQAMPGAAPICAFWGFGDGNIPSGSSTVVVTYSDGSQKPEVMVVPYSGVDGTAGVSGEVTGSGSSAAMSLTPSVSVPTGDVAVALIMMPGAGLRQTATSPAVERHDADIAETAVFVMDSAGAGASITLLGSSATWAGAAVVLKQASSGPSIPVLGGLTLSTLTEGRLVA
jgi:hypothetical protein